MTNQERIRREISRVIENHVDIPPDDCGDNKIYSTIFYFLSRHHLLKYRVKIELVPMEHHD